MGISAGVGAAIGGIASGVGGVASSLIGGNKSAGGAGQSQYLQALEMNQNIANTAPFIGTGQYGVNALQAGLQSGRFGTPFDLSGQPGPGQVPQFNVAAPTAPAPFVWNPTKEGLAQTPGYQFTLDQGLKGVQSSAAARGLGMSGTAMRGAADYATGLADKTYNEQLQNAINAYKPLTDLYGQNINSYQAQVNAFGQQLQGFSLGQGAFQNQFSDYWGNQTNQYKQLYDLAALGSNSATGQGTSGTTAASNIGNAAQAQGQYQGAGIVNAGNALAGTLNSPGVQTLLTGGGANANNQSVTGGGVFNSFSGLGSYFSGSGNYYQPGNYGSVGQATSPDYGNQLFQSGGVF